MLSTEYLEIKPVFGNLCEQLTNLSDWLIRKKLLVGVETGDGFGSATDIIKSVMPLKQRCMLLFYILQS
jgi:hypothetical protein